MLGLRVSCGLGVVGCLEWLLFNGRFDGRLV